MRIGLDFDGTVTADPELWAGFVALAKARGHEVIVTTYRDDDGDNADVEKFIKHVDIPVIYTGAKQKAHKAHKIDVWIDDHPELCPSFRDLAGQVEYCKILQDII